MTPATALPIHRRRRTARGGRRLGALAAACAVLAGCSVPEVGDTAGEPSAEEAPLASEPPDPGESIVRAATEDLTATIEVARERLAEAATASSPAQARDAAAQALAALVRDTGSGDAPPTGPLFPDQTEERGSADDVDDQLSRTLTAARDAGPAGSALLDLLRDPIAGDVGAWQRDAAGVLLSVDASIAGGQGLEQLEVEVGELPGLGTRAVAWARLAAGDGDAQLATAFAERGAANLEVILATLERFVDQLDAPPTPDDPLDDGQGDA